ncbi:hypothetical protein DFJ73DRAFT_485148 [Zopfochytrium polystomum]|nr:hypothetical protein DFJ73DRAFT_485148 [Zopfochytrium polystomum]
MLLQIIPPLVVNLFNMIMPFIIEFLVAKQGLEAYSWVEMRSLSYYFFFLIFNTLLVFTLSSTVWNIIGNFFRDPVSIFSLLAATLPSGATFFINYIIINTMFFPIELLRPGMLIYSAFKRWTHKTPREIHEENLSTSYLNFGMLYPLHILIFIIVLLYSVVAPLILIPGTIYFGLGLLIYRNQLLYVYVKEWEAYGRHWVMAYKRLIIGLEIFLVTMTGMLISKGAGTAAVVPMVLIPLTSLFYTYTRDAFERRTRLIPLEKLPVSPATTSAGSPLFEVQPSPLDLLPRHIAALPPHEPPKAGRRFARLSGGLEAGAPLCHRRPEPLRLRARPGR